MEVSQGKLLYRSFCRIHRLPRLIQHLGIRGAINYLIQRLQIPFLKPLPSLRVQKIDLFSIYKFLESPSQRSEPERIDYVSKTMNWVIPHFELGSGGHMTIFRMIWHLEKLGYSARVTVLEPTHYKAELARELIQKHFMPISADVSIGEDKLQPAEFTFATSWETAYTVNRFLYTRYKLYFVQDMESHFHPAGSNYAFAEATYRFGFIGITAGDWLAQEVKRMYGMEAYPFGFSYDKEHHKPLQRKMQRPLRVFFYARSVTPRRGFELGLLTLHRVHQLLPEVEFVLAGWDTSAYDIPFAHLNAGVVPHHELAELYSQCDVALVLSMTNISLLPLELMACGCPVVSNKGPNVEWQLKDGENALLAEPTPANLAEAIVRVLSDAELRQRLIDNGFKFAQATDWTQECIKVHGYLEQIKNTRKII